MIDFQNRIMRNKRILTRVFGVSQAVEVHEKFPMYMMKAVLQVSQDPLEDFTADCLDRTPEMFALEREYDLESNFYGTFRQVVAQQL